VARRGDSSSAFLQEMVTFRREDRAQLGFTELNRVSVYGHFSYRNSEFSDLFRTRMFDLLNAASVITHAIDSRAIERGLHFLR